MFRFQSLSRNHNDVYQEAGGSCPGTPSFNVQFTGNNAQPSSFSLTDGRSQAVTLGSGPFTVTEDSTPGFTTSFSGDCMQTSSGSLQATGTVSPGQQLRYTITNKAAPTTASQKVRKVCPDWRPGNLFL